MRMKTDLKIRFEFENKVSMDSFSRKKKVNLSMVHQRFVYLFWILTCKLKILIYVLRITSNTQISAVGLGSVLSCNVLVISYLFAQIEDKQHYQMVTGVVTAISLLGKFVGNLSAQVIVDVSGGDSAALPYCSAFSNYSR